MLTNKPSYLPAFIIGLHAFPPIYGAYTMITAKPKDGYSVAIFVLCLVCALLALALARDLYFMTSETRRLLKKNDLLNEQLKVQAILRGEPHG